MPSTTHRKLGNTDYATPQAGLLFGLIPDFLFENAGATFC